MQYSIIIPTLNEERLIFDLLWTLCDNKLKRKYDYEVVVSDSGSKDKTIEISKRFADKVLCFEKDDNKNISTGRHKGALNSSGNVLIFINADVRFLDLEKFFEKMEKDFITSEYVAMTCNVRVFPETERLIDKIFSYIINNYVRILNLIGIGMARGEFQAVKKKYYIKVGGYNTNLSAGEDFEFATRIRKEGRILFANDLIIYESPRRYYEWGYIKILLSWFMNSTSSWLFKKSFSKKWTEVR